MFPKILLWEESWAFFFLPLNASLQTTKQIRLKVSPKITGLRAGRGLWQETMIDLLEVKERQQGAERFVRLRSGRVLKGRGEQAKAGFCSLGTFPKTPIKPIFVCRVRRQSELRWHQAEGLEMVLKKYIKVKNKFKKYLRPGKAYWQIWVNRRGAHRALILLLKKRRTAKQAKFLGSASRNLRYFICSARIYSQPGPDTIANSSIIQMEEMKRIKFRPGNWWNY